MQGLSVPLNSEAVVERLKDSHTRSLIKAFSWRISGTIATMVLIFIFTGKLQMSLEIGALEFLSKIGLFYLHERIWARIK